MSLEPRRRSETGTAAIMISLGMVMLVVSAALVLDFGLARSDRQSNKSIADAAAAAGVWGLDGGDNRPRPFAGVCQALRYLKANDPKFADLTGTWTNGNGTATADGCSDAALTGAKCIPGQPASWARWTGTAMEGSLSVRIQSGYLTSEGGWPEESYKGYALDQGNPVEQGCDQIAVILTQSRDPGLGSVATSGDIRTAIRSVGRVETGNEGDAAVALLVLERHDCQTIDISGGNPRILVQGVGNVPGMIHSDSLGDGADCGPGMKVLNGNTANGIVAETADTGSPLLPGLITTRALSGVPGAVPSNATDPIDMVHGDPYPPGNPPAGRGLLTRLRVDNRYLTGVKATLADAQVEFGRTPATVPAGSTVVTGADCDAPTTAQRTATGTVYLFCSSFTAKDVNFDASTLVFQGEVKADGLLLPKATKVYVKGIDANRGLQVTGLAVHDKGVSSCGNALNPERAKLVVGQGPLEMTNSKAWLRMCNVAVVMGGGSATGCTPAVGGTPPTTTACNGVLKITGGSLDWTAPNAVPAGATPTDWRVHEDLAFWTETSGVHDLGGGSYMHLAGVFMLPNAKPFKLHGGGVQDIVNSQYIARTLWATGNGTLTMGPDPNDVVTFPVLSGFTLVR